MKTYSLVAYQLDELDENAKTNAYENWVEHADFPWFYEAKDTLDKFCKYFDVKVCTLDFERGNYDFYLTSSGDMQELSDIRLAKYLWNNYARYIVQGKYYSLWSKTEKADNVYGKKLKTRRSKLLELDSCSLTGYYLDDAILEPIIKCLTYKELFESYDLLISDCLDNFFEAVKKDIKYNQSFECFEEYASINELEFDEDGNLIRW